MSDALHLPAPAPAPAPVVGRLGFLASLLSAVCLLLAAPLAAQEMRVIARLSSPVVVDGRVEEAAWSRVDPLPTVVFAPEYGAPPSERTEIRVAHDGEFLYASARFHDREPDAIRANTLVRDHDTEDDFFNVVIDTFRDGENAVWFLVTPRGGRVDGAITNNAEGADWNHFEYDSFWDAAATLDGLGWSAEMRVPFSSLRFARAADGSIEMGLIAGRFIARKSERHVFPDLRPGPAVAQYKPSLAAPVRLTGVEPHMLFDVRPYGMAGFERESAPTAPTPADEETLRLELGGDAKIGIASDVTLDLTVNTDFAQTEIDDERVNLTRYSLFFPEKRAFFLERSGTFVLDAGPDVRLFHSRRVGLDDRGDPLRVLGGGRLVGRLGAWDIGVLDMETEAPSGTGRQNSAVVRVRRNVGGTDSWIGAIVTSAAGADRATSITAGVDGLLRVAGDDYVGITAAVTPAEDSGPLSARALARLLVERRNQRGWSYRGEAGWLGSTFDPALGFVLRSGITTATGAVSYGWFGGSRFQVRGVTLEGSAAVRNSDWRAESSRITASWFGDRRGGGRGELDLTWRHEDVWEPFALGDAMVPGGVHRFLEARLSVQAPGAQRVRGTAELSGGAFYDGYRLTATAAPTWVPSRFVELGAEVEANSVWFPARSQRYVPTVLRLRVRVSPDTRLSLHGLLQRNGALGATTVNVRARYTIRDGNDIYLVYTRGRVGAMAVEDFAWRREGLLMKVSATLR